MYTPRHFAIHELAPKALYEAAGVNSHILWGLFEPDLLRAIDWLRDKYGPATINNYKWGGAFEWSGLRTVGSPYYSSTSMHSSGQAVDMKFKSVTAEEIREDLRAIKFIPFISRIESKVDWLHIDTKKTINTEIQFFNP